MNINSKKYVSMLSIGIVFLLMGSPVITAFSNNATKSTTLDDEEYDLLIIAPKNFKFYLNKLVEHKESVGVKTKLVTLDQVYSLEDNPGRDNPEKIKYYIKYAIETYNISYVLLVGGMKGQSRSWYLPVRYVQVANYFESQFISDLYYADIYDSYGNFSSWDSDEDEKYAEWTIGSQPEDVDIDYYPDIAIGRLACRNIFEVITCVRKIINYEKNTHDAEWFDEMLVLAGDTYPEYKDPLWVGNEGEDYADMALENMTGFNPTKLYMSDGTLTHWKDIVKAYNKGYGFVYFAGHGCPLSWSNHFENSHERMESFTNSHIPLIHNRNKLPVTIISGCHNLQFDVTLLNLLRLSHINYGEYARECMGWILTTKANGGSIATLGCTALGHTKEDKVSFTGGINEMEVVFFKKYNESENKILGDVWADAINWYIDTYPVPWQTSPLTNDSWVDSQIVQSWVILGDPSLKIGGYPPN